jgi:hypothetical protein
MERKPGLPTAVDAPALSYLVSLSYAPSANSLLIDRQYIMEELSKTLPGSAWFASDNL